MRLSLLDINEFIEKNKILPVKSAKIETKSGKLDAEGLFSEEIFGRLGSPQRKTTYGYIDLNVKIIHPEIFDIVIGLNPALGKIATGKKRYFINEKQELEESPNQLIGLSGISDIIDNWDKFNLSIIGRQHPENVKFLKKNRDKIFIDKILVLPANSNGCKIKVTKKTT